MSGLITPNEMKYVPKRWGYEIWITNNEKYCGKKLFIRQGRWCSFHHHDVKDEVLFIESGHIWMNYNKGTGAGIEAVEMKAGYGFHVTPGLIHQMHAVEDTMIIEFSTQHFDEDSYRFNDSTELVRDNTPDPLEYLK